MELTVQIHDCLNNSWYPITITPTTLHISNISKPTPYFGLMENLWTRSGPKVPPPQGNIGVNTVTEPCYLVFQWCSGLVFGQRTRTRR